MCVNSFKELLTLIGPQSFHGVLDTLELRMTPEMNDSLLNTYTSYEVHAKLMKIHPIKELGQDVVPSLSYQLHQHIIGCEVIDMALKILDNGVFLRN